MSFTVAALYRFAAFDDPAALRQPLLDLCAAHGVKGTLLLAREGINGTIAGGAEGIAAVIAHIRALPGCSELDIKYSAAAALPFQRLKVRLKKEIVTMKVPGLDPARGVGGSGLGLSLVEAVARLHGGDIALEDNAPGLTVILTIKR